MANIAMPWMRFLDNPDPALFQNLVGWYDFTGSATDSSSNGNNGTIAGGVTATSDRRGTSNAAYAFDGSSGYITTAVSYVSPAVYSLNTWFKTASSTGGEMIGLADVKGPTPVKYDRHLGIDATGHVFFGVFDNSTIRLITSATTYNDGNWHMATATMSATVGMTLYVDGVSVGTNANTTSANMTGWWIMGYNNFATWPMTTDQYYDGVLDDVKIYSITLTSTQVSGLYAL